MAHKTIYVVPQRRKREGRTNYKKRLSLLKSRTTRLVLRKTERQVIAQLVEYFPTGDRIVAEATSRDLSKFGWTVHNANIPEAYLVGLLIAKKAQAKKVKEVVIDFGLLRTHMGSVMYAAVKGAQDGGLQIPADKEMFPKEDRVSGKHISQYAATLKKDDQEAFKMRFGRYLKEKIDPTSLDALITKIKQELQK